MAKINKLLEQQLTLEQYEKKHGQLPKALASVFNDNDEPSEEEESEVESSDEPPKEGTYDQSEDQAAKSKTLEQAKRKQPDFGFHSTGFPKNPQMAPSFMTLGGGLGLIGSVKPPGTGFGRALYRQ